MESSDDEAPKETHLSSTDLQLSVPDATNCTEAVKDDVGEKGSATAEQEQGTQQATRKVDGIKTSGESPRSLHAHDKAGEAQISPNAEGLKADDSRGDREQSDNRYDHQISVIDESIGQVTEDDAVGGFPHGEKLVNPIAVRQNKYGNSDDSAYGVLTDVQFQKVQPSDVLTEGAVTAASRNADAESESSETKFKPLSFSGTVRGPLTNEQVLGLIEVQKQTGYFSYYILEGGKVVIHAEDEKSRKSLDFLRSSFMNVIGGSSADIEVTASSFEGSFCCNRVGARLQVNGRDQTVGMYLSYRKLLYWVSSAHNLFVQEAVNSQRVEEDHKILFGTDKVQFYVDDQAVPVPIAYCSFARSNALDGQGRRLLHFVDIAVGPVGTFSSLVEVGKPQYTNTLHEAHDPCTDCGKSLEDCKTKRHFRKGETCRFRIERFYDMGIPFCGASDGPEGDTCRYYDESLIRDGGQLVRCLAVGRPVLAGRVVSCDNRAVIYDHQRFQHEALNVLLIKPENSKVIPQDGDSGSVWVVDGTNEALAITVGQGCLQGAPATENKCWIGALIEPSLRAFLQHHKQQFPNEYNFLPIVVRSPSGPEEDSRAVSPSNTSLLTVVPDLQTSFTTTLRASDRGYSTTAHTRSEDGN